MLYLIIMSEFIKNYERYKLEFDEWSKFSMMNIGDKSMQAVNKKQEVVARLYDTKRDKEILLKRKAKLRKQTIDGMIENNTVSVIIDKNTIDKIDNSDVMNDVNELIKDADFLISYLQDMVKVWMYIAQDIKNTLDSIKLETM
jgi:uncharacterized protein YecA (UPF0149 family)